MCVGGGKIGVELISFVTAQSWDYSESEAVIEGNNIIHKEERTDLQRFHSVLANHCQFLNSVSQPLLQKRGGGRGKAS